MLQHAYSGILVIALLLSTGGWRTAQNQPQDILEAPAARESVSTLSGIQINEVLFHPSPGQFEWVELKNIGTAPIDLRNWNLSDEDGNNYSIPMALPKVPAGAFVLVRLDGLGSSANDYDFSDNQALLHSQAGLSAILEDDGDHTVGNGIPASARCSRAWSSCTPS